MLCFNVILIICLSKIVQGLNVPGNFPFDLEKEQTSDYWNKLAQEEIKSTINIQNNYNKAKNVILFLGDGMGISTLTAARILSGQLKNRSGEEGKLFFETFPNSALIKTYNVNKQTPDSAGTATAYLTGVKTNFETIGVNAKVFSNSLNCDLMKRNSVDSVLEMARKANKANGIVTTTRITHATPSAAYAHIANRNYENDRLTPEVILKDGCKDIAKQLIEDEPGLSMNVILGGGRSNFLPTKESSELGDFKSPARKDGLDLIQKWMDLKNNQSNLEKDEFKYVDTLQEMQNVDYSKVKNLFGLFNMSHVSYNATLKEPRNEPTLTEMVESAIKILSKFEEGFVLLVEGGRIDHAHHENQGVMALYETVEFENAIKKAASILNLDETLILVTADHSHSFTINGYPDRGSSIFGSSDYSEDNEDWIPLKKNFTTLLYGTGPGFQEERLDSNLQNTSNIFYRNFAAVRLRYSTHGGEDVAIYSVGPWSHLFRNLHEQNYITHVMAFSSCMGNYQNESHCTSQLNIASRAWIHIVAVASLVILIAFYICKKKNYI